MRRNYRNGFTLIELIVVVSILVILSTLGIAAFVNYSRMQSLNTAASDVAVMLQTARSRAQSQVKPASGVCLSLPLDGYKVTFSPTERTYKLEVVCGGNPLSPAVETKSLPQNITFANFTTETSLTFGILTGRLEGYAYSANVPIFVTAQVHCGNPDGLTPDQLCQREVATDSLAVVVSGTTVAKGYWWKQCGGPSISNCNGLDCTVDRVDCTNRAFGWGLQQPYPTFYIKEGTNYVPVTNYVPTELGLNCTNYNPGWRVRVYCSRLSTVTTDLPAEAPITIRGYNQDKIITVYSDGRIVGQ